MIFFYRVEPTIKNNCSCCNFCDHFRPLISFRVGDGYCNLRHIRRIANFPVINFSDAPCKNFCQTIHNVYNLNESSDIEEFIESYELRDSLKRDIWDVWKYSTDRMFNKEYHYSHA